MNFKSYAESRNITLTKVRKLCIAVFGVVPSSNTLTDEQVEALDTALMESSKQFLPPEQKALAETESPAFTQTERETIASAIGTETLEANAIAYFNACFERLQHFKHLHDKLMFAFEQRLYQDQAETFNRMANNIQNALEPQRFETVVNQFVSTFNQTL